VFSTHAEALSSIQGQSGLGTVFPVKTLDETLEQSPVSLTSVAWIKMDVEGCEVEVLRGPDKVIRRTKPKLYIENHYHVDPATQVKFKSLLDSWNLGYIEVGTKPHYSISHTLYVPALDQEGIN
jgi:hypothetical protein